VPRTHRVQRRAARRAVRAEGQQYALSIRTLERLASGIERIAARSGRRRPPVRPVNRDILMTVAALRREADGVVSLRLEPMSGLPLPPWRPGAHLDVTLPSGRLRQYSLCGDPAATDHYRIAVRLIADGGGGSREMHGLRPGSSLVVRGPRNAFPFIAVERYLFVAGGIGITPILPMVRDAAARGADWQFVYTGRTRASMPFLDEIATLDAARVHVRPDDEVGAPDGAGILAAAPVGAALYCCGPPPLVAAIRAEVPAEQISTLHYERFSPPPVVGGEPFEIVLARTGEVLPVAGDETALHAIRAVRPSVAYSCQQGFCGTCPVTLLSGDVSHSDRCLTDADRAHAMAICVSRGVGRVTLDL
jgi:ferredoxin-NADP reductase